MATNNVVQGVIVWEVMNHRGQWDMYEPNVSDFIEDSTAVQNPNCSIVNLGQADPRFSSCIIDFNKMVQCSNQSGGPHTTAVQRRIYPLDSPMATGVRWRWLDDVLRPYQDSWTSYDGEVQCFLEYARNGGHQSVDLARLTKGRLPYRIDLVTNEQLRNVTGFKRKIQRQTNTWTYTRICATSPAAMAVFDSMVSAINSSPAPSMATFQIAPFSMTSSTLAPFSKAAFSNNFSPMIPSSIPSSSIAPFAMPTVGMLPMTFGSHQPPPAHTGFGGFSLPVLSGYSSFSGAAGSMPSSQPLHLTPVPHNAFSFPCNGQGVSSSGRNMVTVGSNIGAGQGSTNMCPPISNQTLPSSSSIGMPRRANTNGTASTARAAHTTSGSKSGSRSKNSSGPSKRAKMSHESGTLSNKASTPKVNLSYEKYLTAVDTPPADEDCAICCDRLTSASDYAKANSASEVIQLSKCRHFFHRDCITALYDSSVKDGSLQCPTCKQIHGVKHGNCPDGDMKYSVSSSSLPGHLDCGTISIIYDIRSGKQGSNHPNPGQAYTTRGFPRQAFIPDNEDGRKILRLLKKAWVRKLTFTIGTSVTTGEPNTVVWNEIHHKTDTANQHGHGYPDPNYFINVLSELAAQGVVDDSDDDDDV